MSEYLDKLKRWQGHKKLIYNTEPWTKAISHIGDLERQLEASREAFKKIKDLTYNDFDHDVIRVHGLACKQLEEQG